MADNRQGSGISNGPNSRPLDDTVAQTGPGIPDDAASPDYDPVADADEEHAAESREPPSAETLFNGP
jgi:hypothetical protein